MRTLLAVLAYCCPESCWLLPSDTSAASARHRRARPARADRGVERAHRRDRRCAKASASRPARCWCAQEAGTAQPRSTRRARPAPRRERRLADLVAGPRAREIDEARAALAGAESTLRTDQSEYERVAALVERKLLSASEPRPARARATQSRAVARRRARAARPAAGGHADGADRGGPGGASSAPRPALAEVETVAGALRGAGAARRASSRRCRTNSASGRRPARRWPSCSPTGAPYARVYVPEPLRARFAAGRRGRS